MSDAFDPVKPFTQKALVVRSACYRDFDEIVIFTCHQVSFQHFRDLCQFVAELLQHPLIVLLQSDFDEHNVVHQAPIGR